MWREDVFPSVDPNLEEYFATGVVHRDISMPVMDSVRMQDGKVVERYGLFNSWPHARHPAPEMATATT